MGRILEPGLVEITDFEPIFSQHHRGTIFALGLREIDNISRRVSSLNRHSAIRPLGFFRTHLRPGLFLDQDDLALMTEVFEDPSHIALLIRPVSPGTSNAGIFMWEDGSIDRRGTAQLFPFASDVLRVQGPVETTPAVPEPRRVLHLPALPKPAIGWSIAAVASIVLVAEAFSYVKATRIEQQSIQSESISEPALASEPSPSLVPETPMVTPAELTPATQNAVSPETPKRAPPVKIVVVAAIKPSPPRAIAQPELAPVPAPTPEPVERAAVAPAPPPAVETPRPVLASVPPITQPAAPPRVRQVAVLVTVQPKRGGHRIPLLRHLSFHSENPADFTPARPSGSIEPHIPQFVANTLSGETSVDVRLSIDKTGAVKNAAAVNGGGSELASLAADTAESTAWEPAREGDRFVSSDVIVHYVFRPHD